MINEEKLKIQQEAVEALRKHSFNGIVLLPTGTGKTFVLIESLKELYKPGMRVIYTCDSKLLRDVDFNKELLKWDAEEYSELIEKECYASAYKIKGQHYNIALVDEGDYALTPEYSKFFFNNTFDHIIFVTASLESKKRSLARKIAPIVYTKKIKEIEERKVINKLQFIYVPYALSKKENERYLQFNKTFREYLMRDQTAAIKKRLEFLQIERSHFLAGLESSAYICRSLMRKLYLDNNDCKILIFCGLNSQADAVCKYSYHSENEHLNNLEKFDNGEITACAVCGKVNRGKNIVGVNHIIVENPKRSETLMIQRTGRGRRLGVEDILQVYLLIPYFKTKYGMVKPTVVLDWVKEAAKNMGIEKAKTLILDDGKKS